jgi:hypothetical protein
MRTLDQTGPLEQRAKARIAARYDVATDSDSGSDKDSQSEQGKANPIPNAPLSLPPTDDLVFKTAQEAYDYILDWSCSHGYGIRKGTGSKAIKGTTY